MSTERTDQYPEVSGEDAGLVPPQGGSKAEWPKKIRTLTASELDRLTIDGLGRFYWDGKLVNYDAGSGRMEQKPVDLDQHAMDLLDRTARELSDPNSAEARPETAQQHESAAPVETTAAPELSPTPADALAPLAPATSSTANSPAPSPVVEVRRQQVLLPTGARGESVRLNLSRWQSIGLIIIVLSFLIGAAGIAASGFVAAHDWGCRAGWVKSNCPAPAPEPKAPARPDIPA